MALMNCPECGNTVSDRAEKCPQCGYPIVGEKSNGTEAVNATVTEEEQTALTTSVTDTGETPKKKTKKLAMIAIALVIVVILGVVGLTVAMSEKISVNEIEIKKWKIVEASTYSDEYEGSVVSDEEAPFVAVIGEYESDESVPQFVYMEEGKGIIHTYEYDDDADPSVIYKPIGYMGGKVIKESDIRTIDYNDTEYSDYEYLEETSCDVEINIELKSKKSGLLFVELKNDLTNEVKYNCVIPIVEGVGEYTYYLSDMPYKSRGVEVTLEPKLLCESEEISSKDYTIEKKFSTEKEEGKYTVSYSGTQEISFKEHKKGLVIYSEELKEGGNKEDRGKVKTYYEFLEKGNCTISTYDWADADEELLKPKYNIKLLGYLNWTKLNTGGEKL